MFFRKGGIEDRKQKQKDAKDALCEEANLNKNQTL